MEKMKCMSFQDSVFLKKFLTNFILRLYNDLPKFLKYKAKVMIKYSDIEKKILNL